MLNMDTEDMSMATIERGFLLRGTNAACSRAKRGHAGRVALAPFAGRGETPSPVSVIR